ncbi:MAG: hypothetical protein G8D90_14395 [gamma proteobacterium symbiont of Clathrolucina costata]
MRRASENTLSLSFTDVLTCVLGAAIALFLIFVAIITLAGSQGDVAGDSKGYSNAKLKSIQERINEGYATSTVKIVSNNEVLIDEIIARYMTEKDFRNISKLNISVNDNVLWGVQFNFYGKLEKFDIRATQQALSKNTTTDTTDVFGFVTVGGMSHCLKLSLRPTSLAENSNADLFIIGPTVRLFIKSRYEKTSC